MTLPQRARITTIAGRYGADLWKRWMGDPHNPDRPGVWGYISETVVDNNALGLPLSDTQQDQIQRRLQRQGSYAGASLQDLEAAEDPEARDNFAFEEWAMKQSAFQNWLSDMIADVVLVPTDATGGLTVPGEHHTAKWVRSAYRSGARDGGTRLREVGMEPTRSRDELSVFMQLPVSTRVLGTLYRRQYEQLEGITRDVATAIGEELTLGAAGGENPNEIARRLRDRVDKIGVTRSRTLARTEMSNAYTEATKTRYRQNGVEQVDVGNTTPCKICDPIVDGGPYPVDSVPEGGPPIHPRCLCCLLPVVPGL